jgi:hypothetical protein
MKSCERCGGLGRFYDDVICGHNERSVERVDCYRCGGKGSLDPEAERQENLRVLESAVAYAKKNLADAEDHLSKSRRALADFVRKERMPFNDDLLDD